MRTNLTRGIIAASLALLSAGAAHGQSAYSNQVMSLNPVAYWPLQETVQPPAANIELNNGSLGAPGNMYYSTNNNTYIESLGGPIGNSAKHFAGNSSAYALVPTTDNRVSLPPGGPFSVEAWVSPYTTGSYQAIMGQTGNIPAGGNNAATNKAGWTLGENYVPLQDDGSGTTSGALYGWSFTVFNGQGIFGGATAIAPIPYQTNTWYHIVGVFNGTNCAIYVNGTLASPPDLGVSMPSGTAFLPDTWDPIQVAGSRGIGANSWTGTLSEIAMYTNALSSLQVSNQFYEATNSGYSSYIGAVQNDNPYMWWHMNSAVYFPPSIYSLPTAANYGTLAGTITNLNSQDVGTNAAVYQAGTIPGVAGPSYAGFGPSSYACAFNGLTGGVDAGYNPALNPTGNTTPLSVVGWFKGNPCDDNGRWNTIVSHSDNSWRMKINNGNTVWDVGGGQDITGPEINVNDGRWHMFAGTYNPANSNNTIYVDSAVSVTVQTNRSISGSTTLDVNIGQAPDHIGTAGGAQQNFAGSIAHIAYFNYTLSQAQIQSLYNAAQPPPYILTNPASISGTISGGTTATFNVTAEGASPLTYTWYYTNSGTLTQLSGDTNLLTLTDLVDANSGSYYVVVANSYGSVTSSVASLNVSSQPVILGQTGSNTLQLYAGQTFTFSVTAAGSNLTYQWYTNGVADTSAGTTSSYTLADVQTTMSGTTYQVAVGNSLGAISNVLTTLTVVSLPASISAGGTYGSNILALNPTAYWPMHETSAGVHGDIETNLGTLGVSGTAYYADWDPNNISNLVEMNRQIPGAIANDPDTALEFKRAPAGYMTVSHASPQATIKPPFSVETWVNPNSFTSYQVILGQGGGSGLNGASTLGGFALEFGGSNSKTNCFSFAVWNGVSSGNDELETPSIYVPGTQWYHVVATYDGTNIVIYVDGQPSASYQSGSTTASMNPDYWSPLCIGGGRWGTSGPAQPYTGTIDEVAIYTNVLSAAQVSKHYSDGIGGANGAYKADVLQSDPLLYFRMDAPAYTQPPRSTWPVLTNYGSLALNGVYEPGGNPGSASATIALLGGTAAVTPLSGNGVFADAGMAPALNPQGYTSFSYTAFFRGYPGDDRSFEDIMSANDATWRASINSAGKVQAHGTQDVTSTNVYNDGNWHQMVMTYQGNPAAGNGTNVLYVDGVLAATNSTTSTNTPASDPGPEALIGNENGFWIMQSGATGNTGVERCLSGSICEAAFFNGQVLSAGQALQLYNAAGVAPFFVTQPASTNINEGTAYTNTVAASGSAAGTITYQWYTNGVALTSAGGYSGTATASLVLNPVSAAMANADYYVVATSAFGSVTSAPASITVSTKPQIVSATPNLQNLTLLSSSTVDFSVAATGATPITYYWISNSIVVQSGTNNSFIVSNLTASGAGAYSVIVSNFLGTATTNWSVGVYFVPGGFAPAVVALKPIGFWLMNESGDGVDETNNVVCHDYISGNDGVYENTILGVPGYNFDDAFSGTGNYDTNTAAGFGQPGPNSCAYNISNIVVSSANNGEFTVEAWVEATNTISDSLNTPGVVGKGLYNHEEFALDCGTHSSTGFDAYRFEVRNTAETAINAGSGVVAGSDTNWHFIVGVCDQVHGQVLLYIDGTNAATASIGVGAGIDSSGDGVPVMIGARTSAATYSPSSMDQQFSGNIADVAIFNYALTSNQVVSEFYASGVKPIFFEGPPATTNISAGGTLDVSAAAVGTQPLYYQWLDQNNNPLPGQTNTTLIISNLSANNSYSLMASNLYGSATSSVVALTVVQGAPVVEQDITPTNIAAVVGGSVAFSVVVDGSQPITYGWQVNGQPVVNSGRISGANANTLVINDVQTGDEGSYQLFATNTFGTASSSVGVLTSVLPVLNFNNGGTGWAIQSYPSTSLAWLSSNVLQLTDSIGDEDANAFFSSPVYIGSFQASFTYDVTSGPTSSADGATFIIQNDPRGANALGGNGGSLGVGVAGSTPSVPNGPITPSVEFEFNIYSGNSVGGIGISVDTNGTIGPEIVPGSIVINSGDPIATVITYANGVATFNLTDTTTGSTFTLSTNVNIPSVVGGNTAYVGFTGADGGSKATQTISDFQFIDTLAQSVQMESGHNLLISFPAASGAYVLQTSPVIGPAANWTTVTEPQSYTNGEIQVTVPITGADAFYRLVLQMPGN